MVTIKGCRLLSLLLALAGCGGNGGGDGAGNNIPVPTVGQWVCSGCSNVNVNTDGSFDFPGSNGAVGYVYTGVSGNPIGKTITMTYTVSGTGTVMPSPASGSGTAQARLFLWRQGDDLKCSATTEWYRWWSRSGVGSLTDGQFIISAPIAANDWTDCYAHQDANQFAATTANLFAAGVTFGAEFFGHGVFSTGSNSFQLNSFTIQ